MPLDVLAYFAAEVMGWGCTRDDACGFLLKDSGRKEIVEALEKLKGEE